MDRMERFKKILKKLLFLPPWLAVLVSIPILALTFVILGLGANDAWYAYVVYVLSAYAMAVLVIGFPGICRAVKHGFWHSRPVRVLQSTRLGSLFLNSTVFRSQVSLHQGLAINLAYVALKLVTGVLYRSVWLIALAAYYLLLAVMRSVLVGYVHREKIGENIPRELRRYRVCGYILLFMNQALAAIVVYIVHDNQGFSYPGLLIYGMALYAFYSVITAVINVVKFRKLGSPVLSAAKCINLTAALVSMLSLETAMLSEFGGDDSTFRFWMTGVSGGVVCTFVLAMAVYMIARSTKYLKQAKFHKTETKL
jgi:hypothetical protein